MTRRACLLAALPAFAQRPNAQRKPSSGPAWNQWGGPNRNFQVEAAGINETWASSGPRVLWKRPLGEGYSSIVLENGVLITMYSSQSREIVVAASAETGKTMWEQSSPVSFRSEYPEMGTGPYATPLIAGGRLFTAGVTGRFQCLDMPSGKVLWTQELWRDLKGTRLPYGYASSPIGFRQTVIVPVGGKGKAVMAFSQADGKPLWSRGDFGNAYSSPILVSVDGLDQLVTLMDGGLMGLNPINGDPQWQVPFRADFGIAVATPVIGPGNLVFISAEYGAGAKVIKLERIQSAVRATEVWNSPRLRLHHGNAMLLEGVLYFSSGGKGSQAILSAVEMASGKILWQERSISKATFVRAGDRLIVLDQDGNLMIAHASAKGFHVAAKAQLLESVSWTPPAIVGKRAYLRDRKMMLAVEMG